MGADKPLLCECRVSCAAGRALPRHVLPDPPRPAGEQLQRNSGLQNARSWSGQGFLVKAERNRDCFGPLFLLGQSLILFGFFGGR